MRPKCRLFASLSASLLLVVSLAAPLAAAERLLPGELPLELDREQGLISTPLPTITETIAAVKDPQVRPLAGFLFYSAQKNHYAPAWSPDGLSLLCLRSDLTLHTCKLLVFGKLDQPTPHLVYEEFFTFEHMPAWVEATSPTQALFASNNDDTREENLHLLTLDRFSNTMVTRRTTDQRGIKVLPSVVAAGDSAEVLYRRESELIQARLNFASAKTADVRVLGAGQEAVWSPGAKYAALVRTNDVDQVLLARDPKTSREIKLFSKPGWLIRNPAWSPDGKRIAFLARPQDQLAWELWVAPLVAEPTPERLSSAVRADEDFRHVGPVWGPSGGKLWYFPGEGEQGHYPIHWIAADGSTQGQFDYAAGVTTGIDLAVCPDRTRPAVAFSAVRKLSVDLFVVLLNHY